ncbi:DUF998 domain-containing protein [Actinoplanes sp. G11-F43]|uniref:DUF998 domain-containing protein n=1 Tax=Actinoplanes sp. G11-F43 TaxID=3424130 RepID=UPI003D34CBE6
MAVWSSAAAPVLLIGGWTLAAGRQPGGFDSTVGTISALAAENATDRWLMTAALIGVGLCHVVTAFGLSPAALPGRIVLALGGVATALVAAFPLPAAGDAPAHAITATLAFLTLAVWPAFAWRRRSASPLFARRRGSFWSAFALRRGSASSAFALRRGSASSVFALRRGSASSAFALRRGSASSVFALRRGSVWPAFAWRRGSAVPWVLRPPVSAAATLVLGGLLGWFALALATGDRVGLAERLAAGAQACWPLIVVCALRLSARRAPASDSLS